MTSKLKHASKSAPYSFLPFVIVVCCGFRVRLNGHDDLPPIVVSLPFKLIFFVVVDGLSLVTGSLLPIWHLATLTTRDLHHIRPSRMVRLEIGH